MTLVEKQMDKRLFLKKKREWFFFGQIKYSCYRFPKLSVTIILNTFMIRKISLEFFKEIENQIKIGYSF